MSKERVIEWGDTRRMNNKVLTVLVGLLICAFGFNVLSQGNYQYQVEKAKQEYSLDANFVPFVIPKSEDSIQIENYDLDIIEDVARKTNVNFLRRTRYAGWEIEQGKVDYNKELRTVEFQVADIKPSIVMKSFGREPQIVKKRISNLNTGMNGYSVSIVPIKEVKEDLVNHEGTFFIESDDNKTTNLFFNLLSEQLSEKYNRNFSIDDLKINDAQEIPTLEFNERTELNGLSYLLITFLFVFLSVFQLSNSKQVAIYRLHGFSNRKISFLFLGKTIFFAGLLVLFTDVLCTYFINWHVSLHVIAIQLLALLALTILNFSILDILQYLNFSKQLKKINYTKPAFFLLYSVKAISIIVCFLSLLPLAFVVSDTYELLTARKEKNFQNDYGIFYPVQIGNNPTVYRMEYGDTLDKLMYEPLNEKGAILFDDSLLSQPIDDRYKYVIANPNYLKLMPLYDQNGKKINVDPSTEEIILCIPTTKKYIADEIIETVKYNSKNVMGLIPDVRIVWTDPNKNLGFSNLSTEDKLNNEIVFVSTSKNSSFVDRNIMGGQGDKDSLKIKIEKDPLTTMESLNPVLKKYNYQDNYPQIIRQSEFLKEKTKLSVGNLVMQSSVIVFSIVVSSILVTYVTLLFFKVFKHEIVIQRINGFSKTLSYKRLWIMLLLQYIFMGTYLIYTSTNSLLNWGIFLVFLIAEVGIHLLTINSLEKNKFGDIISGK